MRCFLKITSANCRKTRSTGRIPKVRFCTDKCFCFILLKVLAVFLLNILPAFEATSCFIVVTRFIYFFHLIDVGFIQNGGRRQL